MILLLDARSGSQTCREDMVQLRKLDSMKDGENLMVFGISWMVLCEVSFEDRLLALQNVPVTTSKKFQRPSVTECVPCSDAEMPHRMPSVSSVALQLWMNVLHG